MLVEHLKENNCFLFSIIYKCFLHLLDKIIFIKKIRFNLYNEIEEFKKVQIYFILSYAEKAK